MNTYESISIIWGARVEDIDIVSKKILKSIEFITKELPYIYKRWCKLGNSKEEAINNNLTINVDVLKGMLEANTDSKFPDLGTRISLWNGAEREEDEASFSARLNSVSSSIKNNFILTFPDKNSLTDSEVHYLIGYLYNIFKGESVRINGEEISNIFD